MHNGLKVGEFWDKKKRKEKAFCVSKNAADRTTGQRVCIMYIYILDRHKSHLSSLFHSIWRCLGEITGISQSLLVGARIGGKRRWLRKRNVNWTDFLLLLLPFFVLSFH